MTPHPPRVSAALAAAALLALAPPAAPQSANPAARGTNATPRFAQQAGAPLQVTERTASGQTPFAAACGDTSAVAYYGSEVEPHVATNPANPSNLVGVWQQDRFTNGGSRGLLTGISLDGGFTWQTRQIAYSQCTGGEYQRATDPWVSFGPDGTAHQIALGFSGDSFTAASVSAVLVARSTDGGLTWSNPATLIRDAGSAFFNDKETITADPTDARFVYATWDRLRQSGNGPSFFARSTYGGTTWEPAQAIFDPGGNDQTIGNLIRVLPDGTLVDMFTLLGHAPPSIQVMRSTDRGVTWSAPIRVSAFGALGAYDQPSGTVIRDGSDIAQMAVAPDGSLAIVWQDARFTTLRDAIAFSRSFDGGLTWSTPVRVNSDPSVVAFTPQVHVRDDGTIAVTYYDLRSNTSSTATLLSDYWLSRSTDGVNWIETRISAPFDLAFAPRAGGAVFLGDYTGLASSGSAFVPFYGRTNPDNLNRTDIIASRATPPTPTTLKRLEDRDLELQASIRYRAQALPTAEPSREFWRAVLDNAQRVIDSRPVR